MGATKIHAESKIDSLRCCNAHALVLIDLHTVE